MGLMAFDQLIELTHRRWNHWFSACENTQKAAVQKTASCCLTSQGKSLRTLSVLTGLLLFHSKNIASSPVSVGPRCGTSPCLCPPQRGRGSPAA